MDAFLGVIGFFGMIGCIVVSLKKRNKLQNKRKVVIPFLIFLVMFIIAMCLPDSDKTDEEITSIPIPTNTTVLLPTEAVTPTLKPTEVPKEISFNEKFMNAYLSQGLPVVAQEYCKVYDDYGIDVQKALFYRKCQEDENIPVLEEVVFQGEGSIIGTGMKYSDKGTTMVDIYLGSHEFEYIKGIEIAKEELLTEYPEEKFNFVSIVSGDYMVVEKGDRVVFSGTLTGVRESIHSADIVLHGTCEKK